MQNQVKKLFTEIKADNLICSIPHFHLLRFSLFLTFEVTLKKKERNRAIKKIKQGFSGGSMVKSLVANTGDTGLIPDPERSHMPRSN